MTKPAKPIKRSRKGCHKCKRHKIKCDENKPRCSYCVKTNSECDYSIKLTWGGRPYKDVTKRESPFQSIITMGEKIQRPQSQTDSDLSFVPVVGNGEYSELLIKPLEYQETPSLTTDVAYTREILGNPDKEPFISIISTIPNLTSGIESLSNALENVADGGMHFGLQNSEIFNKFLSNIDTANSSPVVSTPETSEIDFALDLVKSEAYLRPKSPTISPTGEFRFLWKYPKSQSHEISDIDDIYDSIPPSLSPLPEILNQVPYYRQLMHFWINTAADNLVPAPKHIYSENPFKVLLPQMAMEYPAILTTILALAATSMSLICQSEPPTKIIEHLVSRSCNQLLKMLEDEHEATSDGTLATVLLLSCYEVLNTNNLDRHRAHTLGAGQIVKARRSIHGDSQNSVTFDSPDSAPLPTFGTEGDVTFFLMRWFVYVDVIGALSSTHNSEYYLNGEGSKYEPGETVTNVSLANMDPKRDIDYLLGFDPQFLVYFADLVMLIRKVDSYYKDYEQYQHRTHLPIDIIVKALEIKSNLSKVYEHGEARRQQRLDKLSHRVDSEDLKYQNMIKQDFVLRCTNKLFYNMGLLNLNRRVLQIPRSSVIVQELSLEIGEILETNIELGSSAEICCIFCLFCAACDTLDDLMRRLFMERFTRLSENGNVLATKSLTIMTRCWETGEDWIDAARVLGVDVTLL